MNFDPENNEAIAKPKLDKDLEDMALSFLAMRRGRRFSLPEKPLKNSLGNILPFAKDTKPNRIKDLQANWKMVVGEKLANICYPEALKGKTVTLRANSSAVALLQMRADEILGLISLSTGTNYSKLSFIAAPLKKNVTLKNDENKAKPLQPLDASELQNIEGKLQNIHSDGLKRAIINLSTIIKNID
jgi:hypothetical protein